MSLKDPKIWAEMVKGEKKQEKAFKKQFQAKIEQDTAIVRYRLGSFLEDLAREFGTLIVNKVLSRPIFVEEVDKAEHKAETNPGPRRVWPWEDSSDKPARRPKPSGKRK